MSDSNIKVTIKKVKRPTESQEDHSPIDAEFLDIVRNHLDTENIDADQKQQYLDSLYILQTHVEYILKKISEGTDPKELGITDYERLMDDNLTLHELIVRLNDIPDISDMSDTSNTSKEQRDMPLKILGNSVDEEYDPIPQEFSQDVLIDTTYISTIQEFVNESINDRIFTRAKKEKTQEYMGYINSLQDYFRSVNDKISEGADPMELGIYDYGGYVDTAQIVDNISFQLAEFMETFERASHNLSTTSNNLPTASKEIEIYRGNTEDIALDEYPIDMAYINMVENYLEYGPHSRRVTDENLSTLLSIQKDMRYLLRQINNEAMDPEIMGIPYYTKFVADIETIGKLIAKLRSMTFVKGDSDEKKEYESPADFIKFSKMILEQNDVELDHYYGHRAETKKRLECAKAEQTNVSKLIAETGGSFQELVDLHERLNMINRDMNDLKELDRLLDQKIDSIWHGRSKDSSNVPYSYIA